MRGLVSGVERNSSSQLGEIDASLLVTRRRRSRGRTALSRALQHLTAAEVAARCHVSPASVSKWASGRGVPQVAQRARLEQIYGIASADWESA